MAANKKDLELHFKHYIDKIRKPLDTNTVSGPDPLREKINDIFSLVDSLLPLSNTLSRNSYERQSAKWSYVTEKALKLNLSNLVDFLVNFAKANPLVPTNNSHAVKAPVKEAQHLDAIGYSNFGDFELLKNNFAFFAKHFSANTLFLKLLLIYPSADKCSATDVANMVSELVNNHGLNLDKYFLSDCLLNNSRDEDPRFPSELKVANMDALDALKETLLENPNKPITPTNFLATVLLSEIVAHYFFDMQSKISIVKKLVQFAVSKGAEINEAVLIVANKAYTISYALTFWMFDDEPLFTQPTILDFYRTHKFVCDTYSDIFAQQTITAISCEEYNRVKLISVTEETIAAPASAQCDPLVKSDGVPCDQHQG